MYAYSLAMDLFFFFCVLRKGRSIRGKISKTYSRCLLAEQANGDIAQRGVDQDSLRNVIEVSWNGGLSSRDLRFAVWQGRESRCFAAAVAHDFFLGVCFLGLGFLFVLPQGNGR